MSSVNDSNDQWTPCAEGTLEQFAAQDKGRKIVRRSVFSLSVFAILVGVVALNQFVLTSSNGPVSKAYGGLSCDQVGLRADAFLGNTLSNQARREVLAHLRDCPMCAEKFDTLLREKEARPVFFFRESHLQNSNHRDNLR